jgi:hypothetical protein
MKVQSLDPDDLAKQFPIPIACPTGSFVLPSDPRASIVQRGSICAVVESLVKEQTRIVCWPSRSQWPAELPRRLHDLQLPQVLPSNSSLERTRAPSGTSKQQRARRAAQPLARATYADTKGLRSDSGSAPTASVGPVLLRWSVCCIRTGDGQMGRRKYCAVRWPCAVHQRGHRSICSGSHYFVRILRIHSECFLRTTTACLPEGCHCELLSGICAVGDRIHLMVDGSQSLRSGCNRSRAKTRAPAEPRR